MRAAWIETVATCLSLCTGVACGSGDDSVVPIPDAAPSSTDATATDASKSGDAPSDSAVSDGGTDATSAPSDGAGAEAAPAGLASIRIANWSPASPAVDACIAPYGSGAFTSPIVASLASSTDSGTDGLSFPSVSAYVNVAPGKYDVRFVAAGATCAVGIVPDYTKVTVAGSAAETVALLGELSPSGSDPALEIVGFADDVSSAAVAVRFINAAPALPSVDVSVAGSLVFAGIPFGQASKAQEVPQTDASPPDAASSNVDSNGYLSLSSLSNATVNAYPPGASAGGISGSATASSGSVVTIAIVGDTSSMIPGSLFACFDNAGTLGAFSNCGVLP